MTDWQTLLSTLPSETDFTTLVDQACLVPLPQLALIQVEGADAGQFLQNLLTNDIDQLAIGQSQYSGFCNPKGRLFATFTVIRHQNDSYYLIVSDSLCELLSKRLSMYVLRSKVTVTPQPSSLCCFGLTGELPKTELLGHSTVVTTVPANIARHLIIATQELAETLLSNGYSLSHSDYWTWLDIQAGHPSVVLASQEQFTPQQINLDLNQGVSFKKGCYPGQEVVARLHYLGKASRRLFIAKASSPLLPEVGSEVLTDTDKVAGHIVSACQNKGQLDCLISLKLSEYEQTLVLSDGQVITLCSDIPEET